MRAKVLDMKLPSAADPWGWQIQRGPAVQFACANTRRRQPGHCTLPQRGGWPLLISKALLPPSARGRESATLLAPHPSSASFSSCFLVGRCDPVFTCSWTQVYFLSTAKFVIADASWQPEADYDCLLCPHAYVCMLL